MSHTKLDVYLFLHSLFYWSPNALTKACNQFESIDAIKANALKIYNENAFKIPFSEFNTKLQNQDISIHKQYIKKHNIHCITPENSLYPSSLTQLTDAPVLLFAQGNLECLHSSCFAVVGTRNPSDYGIKATRHIVKTLCEHFTIISGFATGIDYIAHKTCTEQKKQTIAVMGAGLDTIYPAKHTAFAQTVLAEKGLLLSEIPLFIKPQPFHFPMRNRIISGLSKGILVTEAKIKSGSLITANFAVEQNKDVFALPGSIFEPNAEGPHGLIQDGAKCVRHAADILDEYNIYIKQSKKETLTQSEIKSSKKDLPPLSKTEEHIIQFLTSPKHADDVVTESKLALPVVLQTLTFLEIKQIVKKTSTNHYVIS